MVRKSGEKWESGEKREKVGKMWEKVGKSDEKL